MTGRDRLMIIVVLIAVVVAGGWFLVLAPQRDEASGLAGQIASQRKDRDSALADLASGLAAKRSYAHDYATVARLGTAVPDDDNVASLLYQVQSAANASHVDFRSLKVGQSSGAPAPPPPAPVTTDATGAPATQLVTATLPPGAAVGTAGFPTMPFSFEFDGSFFRLSDFMGRLQRFLVVRNRKLAVSGRFMTLDGIAFNAAPKGFPKIKASVAATTYLVPASQGLTNGATASGPATAAAAPATTSTGGTSAAPATAITPVR
ncbi:MAG TPA: hypothetical protein VE972_05350 [Conexibacter sp.]|nr:hypothetical protein [Conexibacter sp.]